MSESASGRVALKLVTASRGIRGCGLDAPVPAVFDGLSDVPLAE